MEISVGKHRFFIKDEIHSYEGRILSRNMSIESSNENQVNVLFTYKNNEPLYAMIPFFSHEPDCSVDVPLKKTILMIKTLLRHVHDTNPSITECQFKDKSQIEQEEIERTYVVPIPFYYFSIAFNGITWYEHSFNAKMKDPQEYERYREKVNDLLYSEELKKMAFIDFLRISQPPSLDVVYELEPYYENANTFHAFFQSMPPKERIRLVRNWIKNFMSHYLDEVCKDKIWVMKIKGGRRTEKYDCPKVRIQLNPKHRGLMLRPEDV